MSNPAPVLAFLPNVGWPELLILGVILLLLFGRRLPEVAKNLGQGIVQFKKGLREIDADAETGANEPRRFESARPPQSAGEDRRVSHGAGASEAPAANPQG